MAKEQRKIAELKQQRAVAAKAVREPAAAGGAPQDAAPALQGFLDACDAIGKLAAKHGGQEQLQARVPMATSLRHALQEAAQQERGSGPGMSAAAPGASAPVFAGPAGAAGDAPVLLIIVDSRSQPGAAASAAGSFAPRAFGDLSREEQDELIKAMEEEDDDAPAEGEAGALPRGGRARRKRTEPTQPPSS